ncbi:hypothetical protein PAXRUDRAFT_144774 [Paxillus rubicundulus Ve08.2h10]|uniref:RING-type domain-containing protein n=1 Tax=Paxillus rubicundulus Ve08.2h10 TaxID=930991 RepID=A0A0D0D994_9AGAM|nr:hypothetical protein PAXRUDRAFT_144774 [Paxillus rubicundulus Ve08.2h10]
MIFQSLFFRASVLFTLLRPLAVHCYVPAQPSNVTIQEADITNASKLHLQWYTNGSDWEFVSYQLVGAGSNGVTQGMLVHFSEDYAGNETTITPWIALVACDANSTNVSQETDIFSMARDRGARSAVLYSLYSETCVINPEYSDPANFDQVFDIFATQAIEVSRLIEYEFGQFGQFNKTYYGYYNAIMLNDSAGVVNQSISSNGPVAPGFIFATLQAYNATGNVTSTGGTSNNDDGTSTSTNSGGSKETGLAMIILYAITGCVSALFCVVIISGAIRAIRHPERYGRRLADPTVGGSAALAQSRARGLGRAILDTFPVVKFSSTDDQESAFFKPKDIESPPENRCTPVISQPNAVELWEMTKRSTEERDERQPEPREGRVSTQGNIIDRDMGEDRAIAGTSQPDPLPPARPRVRTTDDGGSQSPFFVHGGDGLMPDSIGRETCPICIVDFEEGDDLRVLPCEGKHRFHQACVDPWLLELSGSCPICRQDLHALQTIISGESEGDPSLHRDGQVGSMSQNRFSRYLRFARGRQRGSSERYDLTDSHSPTAPAS